MAYTGRLGSSSAQPANFQPGSFGRVDFTIEAPFCNALADAAPPAFQTETSHTAPPADATASAAAPTIFADVTITAPPATATASAPRVGTPGGTPGVDVPTFLRVFARSTSLTLERQTSLSLAFHSSTTSLPEPTTVELGGGSTLSLETRAHLLTLFFHSTTVELDRDTTLALDDREKELVLDG